MSGYLLVTDRDGVTERIGVDDVDALAAFMQRTPGWVQIGALVVVAGEEESDPARPSSPASRAGRTETRASNRGESAAHATPSSPTNQDEETNQ